jgi:hypothetical protein
MFERAKGHLLFSEKLYEFEKDEPSKLRDEFSERVGESA